MSNINDLYKESGIQPGIPNQKPPDNRGRRNLPPKQRSYHFIAMFASGAIIVAAYTFLVNSNALHGFNQRSIGIFFVSLVFVINLVIRLIMKAVRKKTEDTGQQQ